MLSTKNESLFHLLADSRVGELSKFLLQKGTDLSLLDDEFKETVFHRLLKNGEVQNFRLLIEWYLKDLKQHPEESENYKTKKQRLATILNTQNEP